ncbi:MAG: hypothetical protein CVT95_11610 [Bacteroidetes bacterium HGW-Bacteroidetes-12]|nr:MAG: hypothetical protein CVT95_11610 [Bacteroidetes bacterium HGW-Bacteroidetes-12]
MNKQIKFYVILAFVLFFLSSFSQNIQYAKSLVDTLTSPTMLGRGYVNEGVNKASDFLSEEMKNSGLRSWTTDYKQFLIFP